MRLSHEAQPARVSAARRWLIPTVATAGVLVLALTTLVLVGPHDRKGPSAGPPTPTPSSRVVTFSFPRVVSFGYPVGWFTSEPGGVSRGGSSVLVYLSDDRLGSSCTSFTLPNNTGEQICGLSIALHHLDASGIAVTWTQENRPGAGLTPSPASTSTDVGGHTGHVQLGPATGECATIGATDQETVVVADAAGNINTGNVIIACLGPRNQQANLAAFARTLATVRWVR